MIHTVVMNILLYVTQQKMKDKGNGFLAMNFKRFYSAIKNIQVENAYTRVQH